MPRYGRTREYRIEVRGDQQGRVEDCLSRWDLRVDRVEREDGGIVMYASGETDMMPSQLQRELRDLGCSGVSVDSEWTDTRDLEGPVRSPDDGVDYPADVSDQIVDFDAHLANQRLSRIEALLDVGDVDDVRVMGPGDADRDRAWFAGPGHQSFSEYVTSLVRNLVSEFDMGPGEAEEHLAGAIDDLVSQGELPEVPDDDDVDQAFSRWVGAAKAVGLENHARETAR